MSTCQSRCGDSTQQGFGLIELMIALTLGLILIVGVLQVFLASNQTFILQQRASALQEDARFVLSRLSSELRMVNMYGCLNLTRLPESIRTALPGEFFQPIRFDSGVLTLVTADPNSELFASAASKPVSNYGAAWLIATNCRNDLRIASSGSVTVEAGDILIPLRQLEYRVNNHQLQVRSNGAGSYETLIEGVAGLDVTFALAGSPGELGVDGSYVNSVADSDYNRIRSVRLALQLSDNPADIDKARVRRHEYTLVVALRNRTK